MTSNDPLITGLGASRGTAIGPVRIIADLDQFSRFRPGDVLVCRTTSPAWTPLLLRAAAVITEVGSRLAHAAIVAREAGIPAVVGAAGAMTLLHEDQQVRVDGDTGRVHAVPTKITEGGGEASQ